MSILNRNHPFERYFEEISAIPRGSLNEQGMVRYLVSFARDHRLPFYTDENNNVVIYKAASPGYEEAPAVILQAHTDMVCVKKTGVVHDFEKDGIELVKEGNIVRANGTTLGADDGTGVATILGLLADEEIAHPALEALFTAAEEIGMVGASLLDYSVLKGRRLISMDSGGENETSVNSAAFELMNLNFSCDLSPVHMDVCRLKIDGLLGGHSGVEIDSERGNAIKIAASLLRKFTDAGVKPRIASMKGGTASNVIPSSCEVLFTCAHCEVVERLSQEIVEEIRENYLDTEPHINIILETTHRTVPAMTADDSRRLIDLLTLLPHGRRHRSVTIPGFITASANLAQIDMADGKCSIVLSTRAATESLLDELHEEAEVIARVTGAELSTESKNPCWVYNGESELRRIAAELMPKVIGKELTPCYEHGGMETGYFARNLPGVDIYVIGPVGREVHTADEWMDLDSCHRVYEFMRQYLPMLK